MNLLLFSNSTNSGESYFSFPLPYIEKYLGDSYKKCVFIPYAGVTITWDAYSQMVGEKFKALGHQWIPLHQEGDPEKALRNADVIVVGGGNTFQLFHYLHQNQLISLIKQRVSEGIPYIGWSAGSNLACPGLYTTNDMPILQPKSFEGLGLLKFQINPHYTEKTIPNHGGESRDDRITEFLEVNRDVNVLGLREGSLIACVNNTSNLLGKSGARLFSYNKEAEDILPGTSLDFLF